MKNSKGFKTVSSQIGEADNYTNWIMNKIKPNVFGDILEIGLGYGNYISHFNKNNSYIGLDIDEQIIKNVKKKFKNEKFYLFDMCDKKFISKLHKKKFDTIVCLNSLQYASSEKKAIRNMLGVLKDSGKIIILVPGMKFLMGKMDIMSGHRHRYNIKDIKKIINDIDCKLESIEFFNPIGALGWYINNYREYTSIEDNKISIQIKIFDKYILPFSKFINFFTKRFFGQSIIFIITKHKYVN